MKILSFRDFLELPAGTIFSYYEPCSFSDILIKGQSLENDFVCQSLIAPVACSDSTGFATQCDKAESGENVPLDFDCAGREGMFNDAQLYAVYSDEDIVGLIRAIESR